MKKRVYVKADGKYGSFQARLAAREALLDKLQIAADDNEAICGEIRRRIKRVKHLVDCPGQKNDSTIELMRLRECMVIWLLGSEPVSRRLELLQFCKKNGTSAHSNTTLFSLVCKTLGLYSPQDRRKLNRDATAVEFAMTQGMRPWRLIQYFKILGQGRNATYRRAIGQGARTKDKKQHETMLSSKVRNRIERLPPGTKYITVTERTEAGSTVQHCLLNGRNVRAVLRFIHQDLIDEVEIVSFGSHT
jgi:hypothetical protein